MTKVYPYQLGKETATCEICHNTWVRRLSSPPVRCPRCQNRKWEVGNEPAVMLHCQRCGEDWPSRVANPVRCARCTSIKWNTPRESEEKV